MHLIINYVHDYTGLEDENGNQFSLVTVHYEKVKNDNLTVWLSFIQNSYLAIFLL